MASTSSLVPVSPSKNVMLSAVPVSSARETVSVPLKISLEASAALPTPTVKPAGRSLIVKPTALDEPTLIADAPVIFAALIEDAAVIVVRSTFSTPLIFKLPVPVTVERPAIVAVSLSAVVAVLFPLSVTESPLVSEVPKAIISLPEPSVTATEPAASVAVVS